MGEKIGLYESVSIAVGGMVGGGIFAVLGVVAAGAGTAAWIAFTLSGVVALCAGYSFVRLNDLCERDRSPLGQIEELTGDSRFAGMAGWLLTFGYVGTMAMYAYAFGSYLAELVGLHAVAGVPVRPLFSVAAVAGFGGLNLLGARASGRTEDALVASKVAILLAFSVGGIYFGATHGELASGVGALDVGALTTAAIAFVAFEGWELLLFDQDSIENPRETVRKAIYVSVVGTTALYVLVAVVTTNLVSASVIKQHAETALAVAARPFFGPLGFTLIAVAAVISTASALNATLFSAARLADQMSNAATSGDHRQGSRAVGTDGGSGLSAHSTPTRHHRSTGEDESGGPPVKTILVLGVLTGIFTVYGNLNSITSFASGAFTTIFGSVSLLAFTRRGDGVLTAVVPAVGALGSGATLLALFWHLHETNPHVLVTVAVIWAVVLSVYWVPRRG
ncbi:MAG: APC family permease [Halobacteriaceae archaeon]